MADYTSQYTATDYNYVVWKDVASSQVLGIITSGLIILKTFVNLEIRQLTQILLKDYGEL